MAIYIGDKYMEKAIIQGGMGIGISRSSLAGAVAKAGGMGVISTAQVGYDSPDFQKDPEAANLRVLPDEIRKAKQLSEGNGLIGVNIMSVTQLYGTYVETAAKAGVDAIISGAGLPLDLPEYVENFDVKIAPIASSKRSAAVILKHWDKKYNKTADFIVMEGPLAGGHLGFKPDELKQLEQSQLVFEENVKETAAWKVQYEEKYGRKIPLFVAGGIFTREDVRHVMELGADGVQVGSRFVTTVECDASEAYKQAYLKAKPEDVVIIESPVGLPGRAINNSFVTRMKSGSEPITFCYNCLKACKPKTAKYCISQALINAVNGDLEHGLIFCGEKIGGLDKIQTVQEVVEELAP